MIFNILQVDLKYFNYIMIFVLLFIVFM